MSKGAELRLSFDPAAYHPDAVLAAAHAFSGRAELTLGEGEVTLRGSDRAALDALGAAFREEAACQELRRRIAAANAPVREYLIAEALRGAAAQRGGGAGAAQRPAPVPEPAPEGGEGDDKPMDPDDILRAWEKDHPAR